MDQPTDHVGMESSAALNWDSQESQPKTHSLPWALRISEAIRSWFAWTSALLLLLSFVAFGAQPDTLAAITVLPAWLVCFTGLLCCQFSLVKLRRRKRKRDSSSADSAEPKRRPGRRPRSRLVAAGASLCWLAFAAIYVEEIPSVFRGLSTPRSLTEADRSAGKGLRVVTMNCAGGSLEPADEAANLDPDILLLQESPSEQEVRAFALRRFGANAGVLPGLDASIVSRWPLEEVAPIEGYDSICTSAIVNLPGERRLLVSSIRLTPAIFRFDLWNPGCWSDQATNRQLRRLQVEGLQSLIYRFRGVAGKLLAGDFNAPAGDAAMQPLRPVLQDSWRAAGRGWGNTIINDLPVHRIDQVWASRELRPISVKAVQTKSSDHRAVVAEFRVK